MPRVTIWIRNEDWDQWEAIDNKPEWLHERLNLVKGIPIYPIEDPHPGELHTIDGKETFDVTVVPFDETA